MAEKKQLKQRIRDGETVIGVSPGWDADRARLEGLLDHYPYDFFTVDAQHSPFSEHKLVEFCELAGDLGIDVHFRIKHTRHSYMVGNYLDLGPTVIEVPQAEEEATVDEAVNAFYLPPRGKRSWIGAASEGPRGPARQPPGVRRVVEQLRRAMDADRVYQRHNQHPKARQVGG